MPATPKRNPKSTAKKKSALRPSGRQKRPAERPPKTDSLSRIIDSKPSADAALPLQVKFLERCWGWAKRSSHEYFLVAWHAGEILSAWRNQCDHGNSRIVKQGDGITFDDKVAQETSLDVRTAYRWADIFDYLKPDDPNIDFESLLYTPALDIVDDYKHGLNPSKRKSRKRGDSKRTKQSRPELASLPQQIRTVINAVHRASLNFKERIDSYHESDFKECPLREVEAFRACCGMALEAVTNICDAFDTLSTMETDILGDETTGIADDAKRVAGLRDALTTMSFTTPTGTTPKKTTRKKTAPKSRSKKRRAA